MTTTAPTFTKAELAYLSSQRLGRLATVAPGGAPQNNPVGFHLNSETGAVDIYGLHMGATRKFRNVQVNPHVALVVDDLASVDPWVVRGVEIRGVAEALGDETPPVTHMSRQLIRIRPQRVISWGIDPDQPGMSARNVMAGAPEPEVA
jgi:pyridoxamine 5'-phosphate oxidase family protein